MRFIIERLKIDKFKKWLHSYGVEILPPTNDYELLRFRGSETGVLYTSGKTSNLYTDDAVICYLQNKKWEGGVISTGRKKNYINEKKAILKRDGKACFYCGLLMGEDITLEHLIPLVSGGKNTLSNMVLCHEKCNNNAGSLPISKKVNIAIKNRVDLIMANIVID
jgi:hypothetical protein